MGTVRSKKLQTEPFASIRSACLKLSTTCLHPSKHCNVMPKSTIEPIYSSPTSLVRGSCRRWCGANNCAQHVLPLPNTASAPSQPPPPAPFSIFSKANENKRHFIPPQLNSIRGRNTYTATESVSIISAGNGFLEEMQMERNRLLMPVFAKDIKGYIPQKHISQLHTHSADKNMAIH